MKKLSFMPISGRLFFLGCVLTAVMAFAQIVGGYNGDKELILMIANLMLRGRSLYVDIFENNTPLIFWIYLAPAYVSMLTDMIDYHVLTIFTLAIVALSIRINLILLKSHKHLQFIAGYSKDFFLQFANIFIISSGLLVFADREHLFVVLIFPYFLRFMPSLAKETLSFRLRLLVGGMAAIGFGVKPHCLIIFLFLQLVYIITEKSLKILISLENIIIYIFGVLYLLTVFLVMPQFFYEVLPIVRLLYPAFTSGYEVWLYVSLPLITLAIACIEYRPRITSPFSADIRYCLVMCVSAMAYILLNNGWVYTVYPLAAFIFMAIGFLRYEFYWLANDALHTHVSSERYSRAIGHNSIAIAINIVFSLFTASMLIPSVSNSMRDEKEIHKEQACTKLFHAGLENTQSKTFGVITDNRMYWPQVARVERATLSTTFASLWFVKYFSKQPIVFQQKNKWVIDYFVNRLVRDINELKPEVFFVDYDTKGESSLLKALMDYPLFVQAWRAKGYTNISDAIANAKSEKDCSFRIFQSTHH